MAKPRIYFKYGEWVCRPDPPRYPWAPCTGLTMAEAYQKWLKREQAMYRYWEVQFQELMK